MYLTKEFVHQVGKKETSIIVQELVACKIYVT